MIDDIGFLWVCWSFVGFGLDCWFGSVVGGRWQIVKKPQRRCDEDFVGLKCL